MLCMTAITMFGIKEMKAIKILLALAVLASLLYVGKTAQITICGHVIERHETSKYVVDVRRIPYRFSLFTLLYGMQMFPGYVDLRVSDTFRREITSYSVNWDSFYPDSATISVSEDNVIRFDIIGYTVTCTIDGRGAQWSQLKP